jgi:hypothetical protein
MLHAQLAALALAATALVASGCGESSKTESATTAAVTTTAAAITPAPTTTPITVGTGKPLKRMVWIAKGDSICTRANTKLSSTTAKTTQDFARLLPQAAAYERAEATELSKLVPPADMANDWAQIVAGIQKFSEFSDKAAEYARVDNVNEAAPVFSAMNKIQQEFTTLAKRDGFKECANP